MSCARAVSMRRGVAGPAPRSSVPRVGRETREYNTRLKQLEEEDSRTYLLPQTASHSLASSCHLRWQRCRALGGRSRVHLTGRSAMKMRHCSPVRRARHCGVSVPSRRAIRVAQLRRLWCQDAFVSSRSFSSGRSLLGAGGGGRLLSSIKERIGRSYARRAARA